MLCGIALKRRAVLAGAAAGIRKDLITMENIAERNKILTKKRWMVLIASCLINLCIGAMYAWSVFSAPMAEF